MKERTADRVTASLMSALFLLIACAVVSTNTHMLTVQAKSEENVPLLPDARMEGYKRDRTVAAYRTGLSGDTNQLVNVGGSTTETSTAAITTFTVSSHTTLKLSGRFSASAATVTAHVLYYDWNETTSVLTFQDMDTVTLTASATVRDSASGKYVSKALFLDTGASNRVKVIVAAPSSGTVDLWLRSY